MDEQKPDRRVERTRKLIREAMVSLMLQKPYEKITVQDIIDRADIGRSTFYAHYQDKNDLLLRGVAEIAYGEDMAAAVAEDVEKLSQAETELTISTARIFSHVQENRRIHEVMFRRTKENPVVEQGIAFLEANIAAQLERLLEEGQEPSVPLPVLAKYLTGGLISLFEWWIENEMPNSPDEMDQLFRDLAMPGIIKMIDQDNQPAT